MLQADAFFLQPVNQHQHAFQRIDKGCELGEL